MAAITQAAEGSREEESVIAAMAKHLPPSASRLRLLDVNGEAGAGLSRLRADLDIQPVSGQVSTWNVAGEVDAIVAYAYIINAGFLAAALERLRAGGRLIVVDSKGYSDKRTMGQRLETAGYVRILVEDIDGGGVLIRGEKRHMNQNTLDRIQLVAGQEGDGAAWATYRGRYVHLLIRQTPNKPVWRMDPHEPIRWQAVTLCQSEREHLLAFSSLPKAVGFMQPVVVAGQINDINKVGKFSRSTAETWTLPVLLNPERSLLDGGTVGFVEIDPTTAESPDE